MVLGECRLRLWARRCHGQDHHALRTAGADAVTPSPPVDEELDAQYDTSKQVADGNLAPYFEAFSARSRAARDVLAGSYDRRYGPHERELVDLFPAARPGSPLFVFVHGGYWRRMSKNEFTFVAPPFVAAGTAVAVLNYPLAPGPSLDDIVAAVKRGFTYVIAHARELNADPSRVVIGGHSVGAQLAAMIAAANPVRGFLGLSGLYDLSPLRRTQVNGWIGMDEDTAQRNSPIRCRPAGRPRVALSYGSREQRAFADQQDAYAAVARAWELDVRELPGDGHDHFTIVSQLGDAHAALARDSIALCIEG